jgi:hypothetical protein
MPRAAQSAVTTTSFRGEARRPESVIRALGYGFRTSRCAAIRNESRYIVEFSGAAFRRDR